MKKFKIKKVKVREAKVKKKRDWGFIGLVTLIVGIATASIFGVAAFLFWEDIQEMLG